METNARILHILVICIAVFLHTCNLIDLRRDSSDKSPVAHENWFDQRKTLHNRDSDVESKPEVIAHGFTYSPVSVRITKSSWRTRYPLQFVLYTGSRLLAVWFSLEISAGVEARSFSHTALVPPSPLLQHRHNLRSWDD